MNPPEHSRADMTHRDPHFIHEPVTVERIEPEVIEIQWPDADVRDPRTAIYLGPTPDHVDMTRPLAVVEHESVARIQGLGKDVRHYFAVSRNGHPPVVAAERRVPLDGVVNFRDMGGYRALENKIVRWGMIYRSDSLARLTPGDQMVVGNIGIRTVCDFRTANEIRIAPDRLPPDRSIQYLHLPVQHGEIDSAAAFQRLKQGDVSWLSDRFMIDGYIHNIEESAHVWGDAISRLADPRRRPLVFHCTAGKDRSGSFAALVLLVLGVSEECVIYDHALSNRYIAGFIELITAHVRSFGIDPDLLAPYFKAERKCIEAFIDYLASTYGSAENYLIQKAGVSEETITRLRRDLLV